MRSNKTTKKLTLTRETLRRLSDAETRGVVGGTVVTAGGTAGAGATGGDGPKPVLTTGAMKCQGPDPVSM